MRSGFVIAALVAVVAAPAAAADFDGDGDDAPPVAAPRPSFGGASEAGAEVPPPHPGRGLHTGVERAG